MQNSGQLLILAVFVVFAFWVLSRGRRQQREMQMTQSRVRPGTQVMMTSGVYGTVIEVEDERTIRLETSPGIVSRWDRRAVARIIAAPEEEPAEPALPAATETTEAPAPASPVAQAEPAPIAEPAEPTRPTQDAAPPDRD